LSRVSSSPTPSRTDNVRWTQLYLGLGFTTLATLILELALTRIFSVVFFYHFAFLAISVALFGMGAGGVFSYVVARRPGNLYAKLGRLAIANCAAVIVALWFVLSRTAGLSTLTLIGVYVASAVPFFLAGTVVSLAISEAIERVDRAYFFDLAGAAVGCLMLIPFLDLFGGANTVIAAAVIYGVSAAIWFHQSGHPRRRATAVLLSLLLVGFIVVNAKHPILEVHSSKGQPLPAERFVAWNSFSRVGVNGPDDFLHIVIDGDAATDIPPFDWDHLTPEEHATLAHQGPGAPYDLRPGAKTLIIGAGGGYDVARALGSGSRDISAVEINPIIANQIMRDRFAAQSHRLYFRPEVRLFIEDGRSFVRRSSEKYQVLQATLVDTWASTAAGAFALSENNLYTTDAFTDYLNHLTDDGVLTFTRWGFDPPRESLRLISIAMEALKRVGETDPARHVIVLRDDSSKIHGWGALDTVLISRKPFREDDLTRLRDLLSVSRLELVYVPGENSSNAFAKLLASGDPFEFSKTYPYDVSPVDDDRPFFFYTVQPRDILSYLAIASRASADFNINAAVPLLFNLMAVSIAATLLILILPRMVLRSELPHQKGELFFLGYFLCLGAGYILIQVALIQRFILLLGHPTYALSVIILSMLVASGAGSFYSKRILSTGRPLGDDTRLMKILAAIVVLIALLAIASGPLVGAAATWPLYLKVAITASAIAPAAFLMGMPFPSGLRRLEQRHAPSVRWAWSLNAAASVLGSVGAIVLAIYLGLRATLLSGALLYAGALVIILTTRTVPQEARVPLGRDGTLRTSL